jgi:LysM repeat protein
MPRTLIPVSQFHTVVPGQSLSDVARVHNVSVSNLIAANPGKILPSTGLIPGTRLNVPGKSHPQRLG